MRSIEGLIRQYRQNYFEGRHTVSAAIFDDSIIIARHANSREIITEI